MATSKERVHLIDIPAKGLTQKQAVARIEKENNVQVLAARLEQVELEDGVKQLRWATVAKEAMPGDMSLPAGVEDVMGPDSMMEDMPMDEEMPEEEEGEGDLAGKINDAINTLKQVADSLGGDEEMEDEGDDSFSDEGPTPPFGGDDEGGEDSDRPVFSYARLPKTTATKAEATESAKYLPRVDPEYKGYKFAGIRESKTHYIAAYKRR